MSGAKIMAEAANGARGVGGAATREQDDARRTSRRTRPAARSHDGSAISISGSPAVGELEFGPLAQRLGYALRRAQVAVFQDFHATFAQVDIRPAQYSILTLIENNPGLSQTQVSDALGIKKPNMVAMLDGLQARGLVRRAPVPGDRRTCALLLTDHGRDFTRRLHKLSARHEQRILDLVGSKAHARLLGELRSLADLGRPAGGSE